MMLVNGLFAAIFLGWIVNRKESLEELGLDDSWLFKFWRGIIRYIVPPVIGYLIIDFLGYGFI
jgi:SNF family Na+-dependent transporter